MSECRIKDTLYCIASKDDDVFLRKLLRENSMSSWVTLSTEREPNYFKGVSLMGHSHTIIAKGADNKKNIIGMFTLTNMSVHINRRKEQTGYFGSLRINSEYQHKIRFIKQGFSVVKKMIPTQTTVPFFFTSIASDNKKARRLLEANIDGMPHYSPKGQMTTMALSVKRGNYTGILEQATHDDLAQIVAFYNRIMSAYQFSPYLTEKWLQDLDGGNGLTLDDFWIARDADGIIRCCLALWDQRPFKQSVIKGYRKPLMQFRWLYNVHARLTKRVELPAVGNELDYVYIAFFASDDDKIALRAIQEAIYLAQRKQASSCLLGLSSKHKLLVQLQSALKPSIYRTEIETVVLDRDKGYQPCLDNLIIQPEIALL